MLIPKLVMEAYPQNPNTMSHMKSKILSEKSTTTNLGLTLWQIREEPFFDDFETEEIGAMRRYGKCFLMIIFYNDMFFRLFK